MAKSDRTERVDRAEGQKYLVKAKDFLQTAQLAVADGRWNSAGLSAVHAGISAADAAIVASAGLRSVSKDHGAAVHLLRSSVPEATVKQERQLSGLLASKNTVEYEQRLVTEVEARGMVEQAARLVAWASAVVSSHAGPPLP